MGTDISDFPCEAKNWLSKLERMCIEASHYENLNDKASHKKYIDLKIEIGDYSSDTRGTEWVGKMNFEQQMRFSSIATNVRFHYIKF